MLLDSGALITDADIHGQTPLHLARRYQHVDAYSMLLQHLTLQYNTGNQDSEGHVEVTRLLVDFRILVSVVDKTGNSVLRWTRPDLEVMK